jgi:hypothetical protein
MLVPVRLPGGDNPAARISAWELRFPLTIKTHVSVPIADVRELLATPTAPC